MEVRRNEEERGQHSRLTFFIALSMASGTVMRRTTAATGRTAGSDETIGSLEGKLGHLFFQVFFFTLRAANGFSGFKNNGLKILTAVQAGIFKNWHIKNLLNIFLKNNVTL
jgi:hypothetical protein